MSKISSDNSDIKRSGGAKLSRSETVTVRFDLKLNYLCELGARKQRRTKSSFIEWAVEKALNNVILQENVYTNERIYLGEEAYKLWDTDEKDRLVKLALNYPDLLTYEEQVLWKIIRDCKALWKTEGRDESNFKWEKLREHWDLLKQVANGTASKDELPKSPYDFDDDIPF